MNTHYVRSQTDPKIIYTVEIHDTFATCDCPAFSFRQQCKHIKFILDKHYAKRENT